MKTIILFLMLALSASAADYTGRINESSISLSDTTTGNASVSKHGFLPKLPGGSTVYLNGAGNFTTPAGGGSSVTDPNVAHIQTDGNDSTGDGSPVKPFANLQAAVTAGFTCFNFGVGSFAGITITNHTGDGINWTITGKGNLKTSIGDIVIHGEGGAVTVTDGTCDSFTLSSINTTPVIAVTEAACPITVKNACIGSLVANGLNGSIGVYGATDAASIMATGLCYISSISSQGGVGANGDMSNPGQTGGNGNAVTLVGAVNVGSVNISGGTGGADGGDGPGGPGADGSGNFSSFPSVGSILSMNAPSITVLAAIINSAFYTTTYP